MKKKSRYKFKSQVKINSYNLEQELIKQPQLYYEWATASAEATSIKEAEKTKLEIIKSQVEKKIRGNPKKYGIENVTEGAIKNEINCSIRIRKQNKIYLEACSNERILTKAETAFHQRKSMLQSLVQLIVFIHGGDPKLTREVKEERYKKGKGEIRKSLKR